MNEAGAPFRGIFVAWGQRGLACGCRGGALRVADGALLAMVCRWRFSRKIFIGPIFIEILQRKGSELDQMWRGVLWHRACAG